MLWGYKVLHLLACWLCASVYIHHLSAPLLYSRMELLRSNSEPIDNLKAETRGWGLDPIEAANDRATAGAAVR